MSYIVIVRYFCGEEIIYAAKNPKEARRLAKEKAVLVGESVSRVEARRIAPHRISLCLALYK